MADNVTLPGTGVVVRADDVGSGVQVQYVKLAIATDGSDTLIPADASGLLVKSATAANLNATVVGTGTLVTQVDGAALTALQLIDDSIFADDAGFTIATSKVTMAGAVAVAHGSDPDTADAADAVAMLTNRHRIPFFIGGHPNVLTLKHTTITTAVTNAAIVTISTGSKIIVTRLTVSLDNASTVFPTVLIGFATATTPTTTAVLYAHGGFPAGGSMTVGDGAGILGIGADDEDLRITTTGNATGNGLQVTVSYYLVPT